MTKYSRKNATDTTSSSSGGDDGFTAPDYIIIGEYNPLPSEYIQSGAIHQFVDVNKMVPWYVVLWRLPFAFIIYLLMILIYFLMVLAYGVIHANNWLADNWN